MARISRRHFLSSGSLFSIGFAASHSAPARAFAGSVPPLAFVSNPLADYLHLLFFRAEKPRLKPFSADGFSAAPRLDDLVSVPEAVASAGLTHYEDVLPFVERHFAALPADRIGKPTPRILSYSGTPPTLDVVKKVIAGGTSFYPKFQTYWAEEVGPRVQEQIAAWRTQDAEHQPLKRLAAMHRLPVPWHRLEVVAMPFHPAGSANYSPPAVYTSLFREPDLAWVLGHEGTHLLWSEAIGTNWKAHPSADRAMALAKPLDLDLEESMCLLMQFELSRACGMTAPDVRVSQRLEEGAQKRYLAALEGGWPAYLRQPDRWPNLIDYALKTALTTLA